MAEDIVAPTAEEILAAKERIVNRSINPLLSTLPDWVKGYRPHQVDAVQRVMSAFDRVNVVVLDAPTGAGKTLIGETVRRELKSPRSLYICSTKSLQDQFARDFDYAKVLKGRGNYPTQKFPEQFHPGEWRDNLSCDDCTWTKNDGCAWCVGKGVCPYEIAKKAALGSELAVVNTSYFLTEANGPGRLKGWGLVIADEADTLESELMGYVSVDVSETRMKRYDWYPPAKVTVKESWAEWIDEKLPIISRMFHAIPENTQNVRDLKERRYLVSLWEKLTFVRVGLDEGDSPWVYTGKGAEGSGRVKEKNQGRAVSFKPARVDMMGEEVLWGNARKWLLMSATVISAAEMLGSLGYKGDYEVVNVQSTFPAENRRVVVSGVADMAAKKKLESWPVMAERVVEIVEKERDHRVLIHTVSYDLAAFLYDELRRRLDHDRDIMTYRGAAERQERLEQFVATPSAVLLAPSMDRGIDLPGDACRVQIIAKVPFPNLGDRQVSARLHSRDGQTWYTVQTIRTIVQMCGRAVRSKDDWATTYILDRQFESGVYGRGRGMIPEWFREGIVWDRPDRGGGR